MALQGDYGDAGFRLFSSWRCRGTMEIAGFGLMVLAAVVGFGFHHSAQKKEAFRLPPLGALWDSSLKLTDFLDDDLTCWFQSSCTK